MEFEFNVKVTYDKKYYCLAKIADSAKKIRHDINKNEYIVTFNSEQIIEIELMYYLIFYNSGFVL
jgi:hypothetical protein